MPRKASSQPTAPKAPDEKASITKEATVKAFLKENTDQRISTEAIPAMVVGLDGLALQITRKADALSKAEKRTTILDRDIQDAIKTLGGGIDNTPDGLFQAIEKLEPEIIGQLALKIAAWVKEHRQAMGMG